MSAAIFGLTAGFILVLAVLLVLLLDSHIKTGWKFLAVLLSSGFYLLQYESLQQYTGWPSDDALPEKFVLIASDVREPDPQTGDAGVMYWWVREQADRLSPPRVYRLPYQSELHQKSQQVEQEQRSGSQYVASTTGTSQGKAGQGVEFFKASKPQRHQKK